MLTVVAGLAITGFLGIIDVPDYRPTAATTMMVFSGIGNAICLALLCDRAFHDEWIWE
jgi:hypothetical protein